MWEYSIGYGPEPFSGLFIIFPFYYETVMVNTLQGLKNYTGSYQDFMP